MARSPLRQRIVAISAFYAMYVMIRWWMIYTYRMRHSSSVTSKRKRGKSFDGYEIYREACKEMKEMLVKFGEIVGDQLKKGVEAREIFEKVSDELKALPGITMSKCFKAARVIGKDVVLGRLFLGLTEEEKIGMVEAYTDGSMG